MLARIFYTQSIAACTNHVRKADTIGASSDYLRKTSNSTQHLSSFPISGGDERELSGRDMFSQMDLFFSSTPLEGPEQMALDEVLLRHATRPLLRLYCWSAPCVTFGYFQQWKKVQAAFPGRQLVRRSSGGGSVEHDGDNTFSLIIPPSEPAGRIPPSLFYKRFHEALVEVLHAFGWNARLLGLDETVQGEACFQAPSLYDVMIENQKIVGGAQRRSAGTLLHQGSLHLPRKSKLVAAVEKEIISHEASELARIFFSALAAHLSSKVTLLKEEPLWLEEASLLARTRYGTLSWTQKK
ncbi:MAG: hypothetical protein DVB29_05045 [Verrucomicrobia bacterium]|nr:MAG: hypothetical protein DVB29_05045 [Verrucomicrobiota bacterium]